MKIPLIKDTNEKKRLLIESQFNVKIPQCCWMYNNPHLGFLESYLMYKYYDQVILSIQRNGNAVWTEKFLVNDRSRIELPDCYIKVVTNNGYPSVKPKVFIEPIPSFIDKRFVMYDGSIDFSRGNDLIILNLYDRIKISLNIEAVYAYEGQQF